MVGRARRVLASALLATGAALGAAPVASAADTGGGWLFVDAGAASYPETGGVPVTVVRLVNSHPYPLAIVAATYDGKSIFGPGGNALAERPGFWFGCDTLTIPAASEITCRAGLGWWDAMASFWSANPYDHQPTMVPITVTAVRGDGTAETAAADVPVASVITSPQGAFVLTGPATAAAGSVVRFTVSWTNTWVAQARVVDSSVSGYEVVASNCADAELPRVATASCTIDARMPDEAGPHFVSVRATIEDGRSWVPANSIDGATNIVLTAP